MLSQTALKIRIKRKTNPELIEILQEARKNKAWSEAAKILSGSTKRISGRNLFEIDAETSAGDTVMILGKVLSKGKLTKKIDICALGISESARAKLKETKSGFRSILEEIKKNPKAEGVKILR